MSIVSRTGADLIVIFVEALVPEDKDVAVTVYVPADKLLGNVPKDATYVPSELIIAPPYTQAEFSEETTCPVGDFRTILIVSPGLPYPYTCNNSPPS